MDMGKLQRESHQVAKDHGWWDKVSEDIIPAKIALMHSELSEALEEYRTNHMDVYYPTWSEDSDGPDKPEGFGVELADAIIRIFDLAEWLDISMEDLVDEKMLYNKSRSYRHGGKKV